ncbi:DUF6090 family protein [Geojedonia litorea]|uniref:DUF6090 family protein n=1 Tax=Geojedonia litorea TaxID=1268269 RepID=A0ABV9MY43_9FLAO
MIKFFRHIRRELMEKNKTGKYLKYAIGEIVLVVIGILIALSINNWNEERKSYKSEQIFLSQILNSLQSDLNRTKAIYKYRALRKDKALKTLMNNLKKTNLPHDSILSAQFREMTMTLSFIYDKGAYESLKSHGLEIIQNDLLRQKIVRAYENDLPLGNLFIDVNRQIEDELRQNYILELTEYDYERSDNGQWKGKTIIHFEKIKESTLLKNLFRLETSVASNYIMRLEDIISDFENLIYSIETELNKSK